MAASTLNIVVLVAATLLAIVCHPRVFFGDGNGVGFSVVNLDDLFHAGQWMAFALSVIALAMLAGTFRNWVPSPAGWAFRAYALALTCYLVATGIPHPQNKNQWRHRELGLLAFFRGEAARRKANAPPVKLDATAFAGTWRAVDGTLFTFLPDRIEWKSQSGNGAYSRDQCSGAFQLDYLQRDRKELQSLGLVWSVHAGEVHDATPEEARIPVAELACGTGTFLVFVRASDSEVWQLSGSMELEDIKNDAYVLKRVP